MKHRQGFGIAARAVVRYYTALRISAGAATIFLPFQPEDERPPLVRTTRAELIGGFDRRELIEHKGTLHVITLPSEHSMRAPEHRVSPN